MNIFVGNDKENIEQRILTRNILKFLPWEIAHTGVHWIVYYSKLEMNTPIWIWTTLILPQIIIVGYLISIVIYKGESSFYDKISNTKIKINQRTTLYKHNSGINAENKII